MSPLINSSLGWNWSVLVPSPEKDRGEFKKCRKSTLEYITCGQFSQNLFSELNVSSGHQVPTA